MQATRPGTFGQRGATAYRAARTDGDGCNQHAIAADVDIVANHGAVLIGAFLQLLELLMASH